MAINSWGVIQDVLVRVQQFTFPVDFVVMDIEEDTKIPLILGRPFMLTTNYVVDMRKGNMEMSVDDQKITFKLFEAIKHPSDHKACFRIEKVEHEIDMVARAMVMQSPLEKALTNTNKGGKRNAKLFRGIRRCRRKSSWKSSF